MCSSYIATRNPLREDEVIAIKLEASPSDASHSLLYSPTIPLRPSSLPVTSTLPSIIRRRHTNSLSPKRPRPYPSLPRDNCNRLDDSSIMATSPADYSNWSAASSLSRPRSRLSSSLSNAMGDAHISSHPRTGAAAAVRDHGYLDMGWMSSQPQQIASGHHDDVYPVVPGLVPYTPDASAQYINYHPSHQRNVSPDSLSPQSPPFTPSPSAYSFHFSQSPMSAGSLHTPQDAETEILILQRKVQELQSLKAHAEARSSQLAAQVQQLMSRSASSSLAGLSSLPTPAPSPTFQNSWEARTQARIRMFCSLNRAGNALCAWHDSRRERRAYPPRMAPPGYLNCGCTYEEALFEESLARHQVGSYHPGETVRMDPALRNPLLKLLEQRFGYRDGDFERDPLTGNWFEGEGPECWERRAQAGPATSRKARSDR